MTDALKAHYEATFADNSGELYAPLAGMDLCAHHRRMAILDSIYLPDIENATVVDYGVGSWGFASIFPNLKACREAIGFDISEVAIARSKEHSDNDPQLAGKTRYLVSLGYELDLPDSSVDIFFCGECIEHVEDTPAFLTEIYRVMKPGGLAIFTTPNATPWAYRQLDLRWCVGLEHVALLTFEEFRESLGQFFEPVAYYGFNQSVLPGLDDKLPDAMAQAWAGTCLYTPQDATSLIGVVRKPADAGPRQAQRVSLFGWRDLEVTGQVEAAVLSGPTDGGKLIGESRYRISIPPGMQRCNIIFWAHDWSGIVKITCGGREVMENLYSHAGGCHRVVLSDLQGPDVIIAPTGQKDDRSLDSQVILFRVVFAGDR
ncbi:MAG: class I SAM-dependent methyltransferase [Novosphingobium sp.]|nr:class I SAM-dependent methyltransferase [Novosphingobium sp.]